ncbi:hypothetical protein G3I40_37425 [Streptomyces sp. SID14478]|uniref:hypothetical protein n=1 Tax=Streptomyces sp. SID14478 TaxID=2706073 RepID=UPI0013DE9499|nr:hypothetical protein [Streptomyces sp. SID14478]NEB80852.1 hypothetical protein [Streptomyces sp. SID14478]
MDADGADGEYERASAAYGDGLRAVYQLIPDSLRVFARREDVPFDYTAVSRFLSGDRVAPVDFIDCLASVRRAVGLPLAEAEQTGLRALWLAVMKASHNPHHRLAFLEHELAAVRAQLREADERAGTDRRRFEASQAHLAALHQDLDETRRTAGQAQALHEENGRLRRQLTAAADYVKDTERQLEESRRERASLRDTARLLEQEVTVLRRQVDALHQEAPADALDLAGAGGNPAESAAGRPGDVLVLTIPKTLSRIAAYPYTRWQQGVLWSAGAGACVLLPLWMSSSLDWIPGMDYAMGDRPAEHGKACNMETGCDPAYWSWDIPLDGEISTTFWLDISDPSQKPRGTLGIKNGDQCAARVEWTLTAAGRQIASGTTGDTTAVPVTGTASAHSGQVTFAAQRTDSQDCRATLTWRDARVE